jgi:hypothetical protein
MAKGFTDVSNDYGTGTIGSDGLIFSTGSVSSKAAAGTSSQANSTPITTAKTIVVTVSASTRGVLLPAIVEPGQELTVYNGTATNCLVYPASGQTIDNGAANASKTLTAAKGIQFFAATATSWRTVVGA